MNKEKIENRVRDTMALWFSDRMAKRCSDLERGLPLSFGKWGWDMKPTIYRVMVEAQVQAAGWWYGQGTRQSGGDEWESGLESPKAFEA